jgi:hypothetical protein
MQKPCVVRWEARMDKPPWRQAWNDYRGWAKTAKDEQRSSHIWNISALACTVLASIFGAATAIAPPGELFPTQILAGIAAAAAAGAAVMGRQILALGNEGKSIQARATAEGLKSECYRFAAKAGAYSGTNAYDLFLARRDELESQSTKKGLIRGNDPVPEKGDNREPPVSLTKEWYKSGRTLDQMKYYQDKVDENLKWTNRLGWIGFGAALIAALVGALGIKTQAWAPWVGALTTVAAAVAAYGLLDRRKYLAASDSAMKSSLERILERDSLLERDGAKPMSLPEITTATEDLLESEHRAWFDQMQENKTAPNPAAPAPPDGGSK